MTDRRLVMLTFGLLLSACQSVPLGTPGETPEYVAHARQVQAISVWQVEGRIGFRYQGDGGTGAMDWRQDNEQIAFSFRGPLGARSFRVSGTPPDLLLETTDGDSQMLTDPDSELQARFGWSAPFDSLRYWMVGVPSPGDAAKVSVDDEGLLRGLRQNGWLVEYDRYHDGVPRLPRKLTIQRDDVRIRIIVDRWRNVNAEPQALTGFTR